MKAWVSLLLIGSLVGFAVCFGGAATGHEDVAMAGFLMVMGGLFGALTSIILAELLDL